MLSGNWHLARGEGASCNLAPKTKYKVEAIQEGDDKELLGRAQAASVQTKPGKETRGEEARQAVTFTSFMRWTDAGPMCDFDVCLFCLRSSGVAVQDRVVVSRTATPCAYVARGLPRAELKMSDDAAAGSPSTEMAPTTYPDEPATPQAFGNTSSSAIAAAGGVVLSETQLGNMALRAKQQRTKAEQDKQLLQVCTIIAGKAAPFTTS